MQAGFTFRECHDFIMYVSSQSGLLHLLVTSGDAAVADVIPDGVVEEHGVLGNHADMSSQRSLLHLRKEGIVLFDMYSCYCVHLWDIHTLCVMCRYAPLCFNVAVVVVYFRYILPVDADAASLNVIEAEEESHDGALPRA